MPISKLSEVAATLTRGSIAVTGTGGFLGSTILKALEKQGHFKTILAIDKVPPPFKLKRSKWIEVDLTRTGAPKTICKQLKSYNCHTLIHAALLSQPIRDQEASHEIQSLGTMHLLTAAAGAGVSKLILSSTTDVYGAFPNNPNFLTEEHPLMGGRLSPFLKDKVDVERQFQKFQAEHPAATVTILRSATIVGPTVKNFKTNFLQNRIIPTVLGFDPLIQFVHENDVLRAFLKGIRGNYNGIFNIVAKGVIPLSQAVSILHKPALPVPTFLLYPAAELLWHLNIGSVPGDHINFLKYLCVADGTKAWQKMKFRPVYSTQEALMSLNGKHIDKKKLAYQLEDLQNREP